MHLGDLLIEAKLTESDFQKAPKAVDRAYRDFNEVFEVKDLPRTAKDYRIVSVDTECPGRSSFRLHILRAD